MRERRKIHLDSVNLMKLCPALKERGSKHTASDVQEESSVTIGAGELQSTIRCPVGGRIVEFRETKFGIVAECGNCPLHPKIWVKIIG